MQVSANGGISFMNIFFYPPIKINIVCVMYRGKTTCFEIYSCTSGYRCMACQYVAAVVVKEQFVAICAVKVMEPTSD